MQEVREQKSKLNKGFSLVELIVVIAIMAVLVGVIATQFVKYVGQSSDTADTTNIEQLQSAANAVLADPALGTVSAGTYVIKGDGTLTSDSVSDASDNFQSLLEAALGFNGDGDPKYPVASDGASVSFTITVVASAGGGFSATVTLG